MKDAYAGDYLKVESNEQIRESFEFFENGKMIIKGNYSNADLYNTNTPKGLWTVYGSDGAMRLMIRFTIDTINSGDTLMFGTMCQIGNEKKVKTGHWVEQTTENSLKGDTVRVYNLNSFEPYWNPESVAHSFAPRFLAPYFQTYKEDYFVAEMCFKLDDYSIDYYRHKFDGDD